MAQENTFKCDACGKELLSVDEIHSYQVSQINPRNRKVKSLYMFSGVSMLLQDNYDLCDPCSERAQKMKEALGL